MRAHEFEKPKTRFADGYLALSDHLEDRCRERNIPIARVLETLKKVERQRSMDLIRMPFITFVIKTHGLDLAMSKQRDKFGDTVYVVATARSELRGGPDEDVIYLEQEEPQ